MSYIEDLKELREKTASEIRKIMDDSDYNKTIYAQFTQIVFHDERFYLSGDLFTDSLLEFDRKYLNENYQGINLLSVRPIIWGFETSISLRSVRNKVNPVTRIIHYALEESEYNISFPNYNDYENQKREIIDKLDIIQRENKLEEILSASDYDLFNKLFSIRFCDQYNYYAMFYFSASPFQKKKKNIVFDSIMYDFNTFYSCLSGLNELQNIDITSNLLQFKPCKVREYNVGQGNFSELIDNQNKKIVFDPGITYYDEHNRFYAAVKELEKLDAECYFISHFDLDHILGSIYLDDSQFCKDKLWIVPEIEGEYISTNAIRLIWYLQNTTKLRIIKNSTSSNKYFFNPYINIFKGTAKPWAKAKTYKGASSLYKKKSDPLYVNCSGIMISVEGNSKKALLSGDCLYNYWSTEVLNPSITSVTVPQKYDYLIVPHHGCKVTSLASVMIMGTPDAEAVVPVGRLQRKYHHPNYYHIEKLTRNGFKKIYLTFDLRKEITGKIFPIGKDCEIVLNRNIVKSPKSYIDLPLN